MLGAGVSVSLGGDSANGSDYFDMLRLIYLTALVPKDARLDPGVMPPESVLEMATLHGARSLGLEDQIGSLEPGKGADMVIFDLGLPEQRPLLDPVSTVVHSTSAARVRTVCWWTGASCWTTGAWPRWTSARSSPARSGWRAPVWRALGSPRGRSGH